MDHSTNDHVTSFSKTSLSETYDGTDVVGRSMEVGSRRRTEHPRRVHKLRYDTIPFVGREIESEILHSRLRRIEVPHPSAGENNKDFGRKELVLIRGKSGVGKSCLANRLQDWTVSEFDTGLFVRGTYELGSKTPYSGIAQAIGNLCRKAKSKIGDSAESNIGNRLKSELGSDIQLLQKLIPELQMILPKPETQEEKVSVHDDGKNGFEAGMERWKHMFRVLIKVINSYFLHLVIVLDDLQWVDIASLSLLEFLLTDTENTNGLLVVGCYRSNEVNNSHVLAKAISILGDKTERRIFRLAELELGNLSLEETNKIIMAMLDIDNGEKTKALAKVCFKRTLGNPFFLMEFMTMLKANDLIKSSLGRWEWQVPRVAESTMSIKNVEDLLQKRMNKLPKDLQLLLQYSANLGSSFHLGLLQPIWSFHSSNTCVNKEKRSLQSMFKALARDRYMEQSQDNTFHWVHHKIQEKALCLGGASNPAFQLEIGIILSKCLGNEELEESLFTVVNLINKGKMDDIPAPRRMEFCRLNLRAAQKAQSMSAFDSASRYVSAGIQLLPPDKWSPCHREQTLQLYAIGAEMALASGNLERMDRYSDLVLFRHDCTTVEKLPLYLTLTYRQATMEEQYERAMDLAFAVLQDLGCPVMKHGPLAAVRALRALMRIVRTARKSEHAHPNLPLMTDKRQLAIMRFLDRCLYTAFMTQRATVGMAIAAQMYDITSEHGISPQEGPAFAMLSMFVITALKDYDTAAYFAEMGIQAQRKTNSNYNQASTLYLAAFGALSWRRPLHDCSNRMLEAYRVGMKSGNTVYGVWSLYMHYIIFPFVMGKALGPTLAAATTSIPVIEEARQKEQATSSRLLCQAMANLMGKSNQTTRIQGDWFDSEGWTPPLQLEAEFHFLQLALFIYFDDFEAAAEVALTSGDSFEKKASGCFLVPPENFLRGVALYAMARKTNKWRYRRAAQHILQKFKGWVIDNPNVASYHCLLQAEQAAFRGKHTDAESFYKEAIRSAEQAGQWQVAGLGSERYTDFLLTEMEDLYESFKQRKEAIRFYSEWGANAVVKRIQDGMTCKKDTAIET